MGNVQISNSGAFVFCSSTLWQEQNKHKTKSNLLLLQPQNQTGSSLVDRLQHQPDFCPHEWTARLKEGNAVHNLDDKNLYMTTTKKLEGESIQ